MKIKVTLSYQWRLADVSYQQPTAGHRIMQAEDFLTPSSLLGSHGWLDAAHTGLPYSGVLPQMAPVADTPASRGVQYLNSHKQAGLETGGLQAQTGRSCLVMLTTCYISTLSVSSNYNKKA